MLWAAKFWLEHKYSDSWYSDFPNTPVASLYPKISLEDENKSR